MHIQEEIDGYVVDLWSTGKVDIERKGYHCSFLYSEGAVYPTASIEKFVKENIERVRMSCYWHQKRAAKQS